MSKSKLLTSTSLAAIILALAAGPAHAVPVGGTIVVNGAAQGVFADPNADPAIRFVTDHTAFIVDGVDVTGTNGVAISTDSDGNGWAVFDGSSTVTGNIGAADSYLGDLTANDLGSGVLTVGGDVFANNVYVYGNAETDGGTPTDGAAEFQGDLTAGSVVIENDGLVLFSGDNAAISTDVYTDDDDYGYVYFAGQDASFTGDIGDEENYLYDVGVGNDTTFTGNLYAYDLYFSSGLDIAPEPVSLDPTSDHTLTVGDESYIAADVYTDVDGEGTLDFLGDAYVEDSIGESDYRLNTVRGGTDDGVLEIDGDVYANNIEVVDDVAFDGDPVAGAVSLYGSNIYADEISFLNDGLLVVDSDGAYISADITTENVGEGTFQLLSGAEVDGDVGTEEAPLAQVDLQANAMFDGDVNADELTLTDNGDGSNYTLEIQGNLNADVTTDNDENGRVYLYNNAFHKQIGTDDAWLEEVRYQGGFVVLDDVDPEYTHVMGGDVYADLTRLESGVTLDLGGEDRAISADFLQSGTLSLGENALTVGGMMGNYDDLAPTRLLETRVINTTVFGENATDLGRVVAGNDINMDNVTVNVTLPDGINPRGVSYEFLTSEYGEILNLETALVQGGAVWTWTLGLNDDANIAFLEGSRDSGGYEDNADGLDDNGSTIAGVLDDIVDSGEDVSDDLDDLIDDLDNLGGDDLGDALNDLAPNDDGGAGDAMNDAVDGAKGRIGGRLGGRRGGGSGGTDVAMNGSGGVNAGDMATERNAWIALSGDHGRQGFRNSQSGFEVGSVGVAMGADKILANDGILGAALAVADADVKHKDTRAGDKTGVRSYQAYVYGSTRKGGWTIDGMAGLGLHQIENRRNTITGTAHGDYDAKQVALQVNAGYDMPVGRDATFTPIISADYLHLAEDGYTETGAGGSNLTVDDNNIDQFTTGLGARIGWDYKPRVGMHVSPELHAVVNYDWTNAKVESTAHFTGGGATFTTQGGKPDRTSLNLGGSMDMAVNDQTTVSLSYDAELKDKYVGQSGMVKAKFRF